MKKLLLVISLLLVGIVASAMSKDSEIMLRGLLQGQKEALSLIGKEVPIKELTPLPRIYVVLLPTGTIMIHGLQHKEVIYTYAVATNLEEYNGFLLTVTRVKGDEEINLKGTPDQTESVKKLLIAPDIRWADYQKFKDAPLGSLRG